MGKRQFGKWCGVHFAPTGNVLHGHRITARCLGTLGTISLSAVGALAMIARAAETSTWLRNAGTLTKCSRHSPMEPRGTGGILGSGRDPCTPLRSKGMARLFGLCLKRVHGRMQMIQMAIYHCTR